MTDDPMPHAADAEGRRVDIAAWTQRAILVGGLVLAVFALYVGQAVLMPIVLAVLLSFLLAPLCDLLERAKLPRAVSAVSVTGLAVAVVLGVAAVVATGANGLLDNLELYKRNAIVKIDALDFSGSGVIDELAKAYNDLEEIAEGTVDQAAQPGEEGFVGPLLPPGGVSALKGTEAGGVLDGMIQPVLDRMDLMEQRLAEFAGRGTEQTPLVTADVTRQRTAAGQIFTFLGGYVGSIGTAGLVLVLVLFILLERDGLRDKGLRLASGGRLDVATEALEEAGQRISSYLVAQAIVNATYGLAVALGLLAVGLIADGSPFPSWALWGLLCCVLRFIPYLGPWLGAAFPIVVSFGAYESAGVFFTVAGLFVVFELLSNNVMEPLMYGSSTGMSPVSVLLAAIFWGWLWGPVGLVVATPLTVCLVVLGRHVPQLGFFDVLLREDPVLDEPTRVYQRLIARDEDEATEVCEDYLKAHALPQLFDDVLIPAMSRAESQRHDGLLSAERSTYFLKAMGDLIDDLADRHAGEIDGGKVPRPPTVEGSAGEVRELLHAVVLPARDEADALAGRMLARVLQAGGFRATVLPATSLASEQVEAVRRDRPAAVVVSAVPPGGRTRARYLLKKLRPLLADQPTRPVTALWGCDPTCDDTLETKRQLGEELGIGGVVEICCDMPGAVEDIRNAAAAAVFSGDRQDRPDDGFEMDRPAPPVGAGPAVSS